MAEEDPEKIIEDVVNEQKDQDSRIKKVEEAVKGLSQEKVKETLESFMSDVGPSEDVAKKSDVEALREDIEKIRAEKPEASRSKKGKDDEEEDEEPVYNIRFV